MADAHMQLAIKIRADLKEAYDAFNQLTSSLGGVDASVSKTRRGLESISGQLERNERLVKQLAGAWFSFGQLKTMVELADQYGQMASRIKMATASTEEYEAVQARLLATANATYRPLVEVQEVVVV
jgi:uncharacterized phage infection (PIP) family protein YhgE